MKRAAAHDVSAPLTLLRIPPEAPFAEHEPRAIRVWRDGLQGVRPDAVIQAATPPLLVPAAARAIRGLGDGFRNRDGSLFRVGGFPPDAEGDVGPDHYVQIVNSSIAVFDKAGGLLFGGVPTNTLWSGFGGSCETHDDGDGVVLYDPLADRWFVTQFAVRDVGPWFQCVAVSVTGDPTGQYYRYAYQYDGFNDYGKFGVWPDAYYATYNSFNASRVYRGAVVCAFDRASMLQGLPAAEQCFKLFQTAGPQRPGGLDPLYGNILPADLDGQNPPPAGAPNPLLSFDSARNLQLWKFHVDWVNPANTTLIGSGTCDAASCPPTLIRVADYVPLCFEQPTQVLPDGGPGLPDGGPPTQGTCVPQKGGALPLDSLADRPMFRVAYRNFADHESLLLNHSVRAGAGGGVRWYELRGLTNPAPGSVPVLYQQGTYAPDADYRWMGSAAMDSAGNIGLSFSRSGVGIDPGISFTARDAVDAPGVMGLGEGAIVVGNAPQNVPGMPRAAVRWGDYSNLTVDPADDCTFWLTNEYIPQRTLWGTAISFFQLPSCQLFSPVLTPRTGVLERGGKPAFFTLTLPAGTGPAGPFDLSTGELPAGVTATFSQLTLLPGQGAVLTLAASAGAVTSLGVPVAVAATLRTNNQPRYQVLTLDILGDDFAVSASPVAVVLSAGTAKRVTLQTRIAHGGAEPVAFAIGEALPPGLSASFTPPAVLAGGATTLTLTASADVAAQSATLAVRASSSAVSHVLGVSQTTLTLPTASLDAPAAGTRLVGSQTFTLSGGASRGTSISQLELLVDGRFVAGSATASPAAVVVDTRQLPNGTHQFAARATDANGGTSAGPALAMTVENPTGCGCSGTGGGLDAAGLCGALAFAVRRLARARAARRAR
ncbi:MAG: hypothetical protein NVS4B10_00620 [Myxococcales bacterium]